MARRMSPTIGAVLLGASFLASATFAFSAHKEAALQKSRNGLASRAFAARETAVTPESESMATAAPFADKARVNAFENFKLLGRDDRWAADVDKRTGLVSYVEGSGIPWVPGRGNNLGAQSVKRFSADGQVNLATMEKAAR